VPKYARYTIALPVAVKLFEILDLALLARYKRGKSQLLLLQKIDTHLQSILIRLRILHTTHNIDIKPYTILVERVVELGKITGGWIKNIQ
jgi:hypothetical protein